MAEKRSLPYKEKQQKEPSCSMGIPERLLKNLSWLLMWVPSLGTGSRLHLEESIFSISDSDSGVPPSFVKLVPSWLKCGQLAVLVVSKKSVLHSDVLSS